MRTLSVLVYVKKIWPLHPSLRNTRISDFVCSEGTDKGHNVGRSSALQVSLALSNVSLTTRPAMFCRAPVALYCVSAACSKKASLRRSTASLTHLLCTAVCVVSFGQWGALLTNTARPWTASALVAGMEIVLSWRLVVLSRRLDCEVYEIVRIEEEMAFGNMIPEFVRGINKIHPNRLAGIPYEICPLE
jgi:hypothetical protein